MRSALESPFVAACLLPSHPGFHESSCRLRKKKNSLTNDLGPTTQCPHAEDADETLPRRKKCPLTAELLIDPYAVALQFQQSRMALGGGFQPTPHMSTTQLLHYDVMQMFEKLH